MKTMLCFAWEGVVAILFQKSGERGLRNWVRTDPLGDCHTRFRGHSVSIRLQFASIYKLTSQKGEKQTSSLQKRTHCLGIQLRGEIIIPLIQLLDRRKDTQCQAFVKRIIVSRPFKIVMISTVSVNAFLVVLCTDYTTRYKLFRLFEVSRQMDPLFFPVSPILILKMWGNFEDILFKKIFCKKILRAFEIHSKIWE